MKKNFIKIVSIALATLSLTTNSKIFAMETNKIDTGLQVLNTSGKISNKLTEKNIFSSTNIKITGKLTTGLQNFFKETLLAELQIKEVFYGANKISKPDELYQLIIGVTKEIIHGITQNLQLMGRISNYVKHYRLERLDFKGTDPISAFLSSISGAKVSISYAQDSDTQIIQDIDVVFNGYSSRKNQTNNTSNELTLDLNPEIIDTTIKTSIEKLNTKLNEFNFGSQFEFKLPTLETQEYKSTGPQKVILEKKYTWKDWFFSRTVTYTVPAVALSKVFSWLSQNSTNPTSTGNLIILGGTLIISTTGNLIVRGIIKLYKKNKEVSMKILPDPYIKNSEIKIEEVK